jgi:hypothetical protein
MPSELSRQLGDFRTKHKVVPVTQKVSFLFDPTRAAGLDTVSLALIARKSLLKLATVEPALEVFEDVFNGTGKSMDFLTQEELAETQERLKRLLSFLSGHFKSLDAQQCLEYLIQKYQIHVYNGEDLIMFALPYHDTPLFGTLMKLIPFLKNADRANASETRWTFLRNVHKTGSPLSRLALVRMCRASQPVMAAIIDHTIDSLKYGAFNQPLLSFVNVLLLEVLGDFNSIKYDISISLFSLCRICFKAAQHCVSAFFVGLSVATHIVCVANVRDDALTLLLTRAVTVCPNDKLHALLMALAVVASRRDTMPPQIIESVAQLESETVKKAVEDCINLYNANLSPLAELSPLIADLIASTPAKEQAPAPQLVPEEPAAEETMESSDDDSSSDSDDDELGAVRKILTGLVTKGTKQERLAAIEKYAAVEGATRHCIRLAALCDSVEGLATTMRNAKRDQGFVPTLISVLSQFKKSDPRLILEAAFGELPKIPSGAITEVAKALDVEYAGSLLAIAGEREDEFVVSGKGWKAIACICAGHQNPIGKSSLVTQWRSELLPEKFLASHEARRIADTFIEYANNPTVKRTGTDADSVIGQLVCSIVMPNNVTRQALTCFVQESIASLSVAERTSVVAEVVKSGSPAIIKKLNEIEISNIDSSVIEVNNLLANGGSLEGWTLLKSLVSSCGLQLDWSACISSLSQSKSGAIACAAWRCLTSGAASIGGSHQESMVKLIIEKLKASSESATVSAETGVMLETLLAISMGEGVDTTTVSELITQLLLLVINSDQTINDTLVVTAQSVCESLLTRIDFEAAWTLLLKIMANEIFAENIVAVQIRSVQLLSFLISSRDDVDSETITSKQLGQVILGLVDLISCSGVTSKDSWTGLGNTDEELCFAIEKTVIEFLLQCTLKKLDRFFRRMALGDKVATILRVYSAVCEQGGEAVALALLPTVNDHIKAALTQNDSNSKKRKKNLDVMIAALAAISASCVEQIPEANVTDLIESIVEVPGTVEDIPAIADACNSIVRVASSDQIKMFTKLLMQRTTNSSTPFVQESVVRIIHSLWKSSGEVMVPAITEITVFLHELYNSSEPEIVEAVRALVKEMDRITGEDIEAKLTGDMHD